MSDVVTAKVSQVNVNNLQDAAEMLKKQGKIVEEVLGWGTHTVYNRQVEGFGVKLKGCRQNVVFTADGSVIADKHPGWFDETSVEALEDMAYAIDHLREYESDPMNNCTLTFNETTRTADLVVLTV